MMAMYSPYVSSSLNFHSFSPPLPHFLRKINFLFDFRLIIIKTSSTGPNWKNKFFNKLLRQPHKHLHHRKTKKQTQGSNQRLTAPLNQTKVPVSNICSVGQCSSKCGSRPTGGSWNNFIFFQNIFFQNQTWPDLIGSKIHFMLKLKKCVTSH